MVAPANTFQSTSAVGNRESLADVVSRITPEDTPILSKIGSGMAKNTYEEWEIDELESPSANFHAEGNDYDFDAIIPPQRIGNRTQIFKQGIVLSKTQEAITNAGNAEKMKYQSLKKAIKIKKDVELAILSNTASVSGATRKFGSLASFYETNVNRGTGGANGGFNQTTKLTEAATAGTKRAFTHDIMKDVLEQVYKSGGNAKYMVCSPHIKSVFSTFMSDPNVAQFRTSVSGSKNTIDASAEIYHGDFGYTTVIPNRVMSENTTVASNVHFIDPAMLEMKWLRKIMRDKDIGKTGDSEKEVVIGEGTLCVKNEQALGVAADIFGTSATS